MFDRKRPCANCPFKKGNGQNYGLSPERLEEIRDASAFQCHKTVDYAKYDDPVGHAGTRPQQCAGLMAVLHRESYPNQIMQVAERLDALDPDLLDPKNEAYETWDDVVAAHAGLMLEREQGNA